MKKMLIGLVFLNMAAVAGAQLEGGGLDSPLSVEIKMTKAVYAPHEPVDGLVVITNTSMISFPATFDIQLFYEDTLQEEVSAEIKSFLPGDNKYNFKELGVPQTHPHAEGRWRLIIVQKNVDPAEYAAEAVFIVQDIQNSQDESSEETQN